MKAVLPSVIYRDGIACHYKKINHQEPCITHLPQDSSDMKDNKKMTGHLCTQLHLIQHCTCHVLLQC